MAKDPSPVKRRFPITRRDVKTVALILILFPLAWLVPERHWRGLCGLLTRIIGRRARRDVAALADTVADTFDGLSHDDAVGLVQRWRANGAEGRLQYFREYRPGGWRSRIEVRGLDHVEAARTQGQGVILWVVYQVFASLVVKKGLSQAGLAVHHVSSPAHGLSNTWLGLRYLNRIITRIEDRYLAERIPYHQGRPAKAVSAMQRRLRDRLVLSITAGTGRRSTVALPVVGGRLNLPISLGPLKLAQRTGAVLLPCYIDRADDGTFTVHITPPLDLEAADDADEAAATALRELSDRLTPVIEAQPTMWNFWRRGRDLLDGGGSGV